MAEVALGPGKRTYSFRNMARPGARTTIASLSRAREQHVTSGSEKALVVAGMLGREQRSGSALSAFEPEKNRLLALGRELRKTACSSYLPQTGT